jgi:murein DD-endopeptidase MepM/ murein hydrolase activator NlpD
MAKAVWPSLSLCVCVGATLGAAATFVLPSLQPSQSQTASSISSLFAPAPLSDEQLQSAIEHDLADIQLAVRRVASAAFEVTKTVTIRAGDTLSDVLVGAGVEREVTHNIVDAMKPIYNPRRLQTGQALQLSFTEDPHSDDRHLAGLSFELSPSEKVAIERTDDGNFSAKTVVAETHRELQRFDGVISSSLSEAAAEAGVPGKILNDMVSMFSHDVDFQRDIQEGDEFSVMFERVVTKDGRLVRTEGIKVASMTLSGVTNRLYAYRHTDGFLDYYNEKGEGFRKALLRTPINGARLTSGFGMRRHPILGFSKMHQGIDFGAATGTPVFAAGDGVIERREVFGGYGNYIRIRHGSGYSTAYAHLSRFGKDIRVGTRVRQNQVIGYVGTTGRSTGPHLHYEVLRDARQVNPMTVKFPSSQKLEGTTLARFKETRNRTDEQYASLLISGSVAMAGPSGQDTKLR